MTEIHDPLKVELYVASVFANAGQVKAMRSSLDSAKPLALQRQEPHFLDRLKQLEAKYQEMKAYEELHGAGSSVDPEHPINVRMAQREERVRQRQEAQELQEEALRQGELWPLCRAV